MLPAYGTFLGVGCMSGTSLDGLDMAAVSFSLSEDGNTSFTLREAETLPYPAAWRERLATLPHASAEGYARTHTAYGHWQGAAIAGFLAKHGLHPDFVATHGHTIFHQPVAEEPFTAQIGDGETLVTYLPCPLVTQFRNKDVALGGQGAPLVPFGERSLFAAWPLLLNLGGFANLTLNRTNAPLAFDLTACNLVLNRLAEIALQTSYDTDGQLARSGTLRPTVLAAIEQLPFFRQPPPKSLGTEWLEAEAWPVVHAFLDQGIPPADLAATWCRHVSRTVALAVETHHTGGGQMLVSGGGRYHTFLLDEIRTALLPCGVTIPETDKTVIEFKEAIVFAWLGLCTLRGKPNVLRETTGARVAGVCGSIHLPQP